MALAVTPTGPKDIRDAEWLAEQVADLGRGIEAARLIWENWFDGRHVGRLHPGQTPGEYIASLGMRLTLPEALAAMPEASNPQIAAVTGVDQSTVYRNRERFADANPDRVTGADGKSYPRVVREVKAEIIEQEEEPSPTTWPDLRQWLADAQAFMGSHNARSLAGDVPPGSHERVARSLRRVGSYMGEIALVLEDE